jgi:hypothetical protein
MAMVLILLACIFGAMYCAFQVFCAWFELMVWNHQEKLLAQRQQARRSMNTRANS